MMPFHISCSRVVRKHDAIVFVQIWSNICRLEMILQYIFSSYAYMRGPLKIQVNWPEKSLLVENTLENTKINVFEIQY